MSIKTTDLFVKGEKKLTFSAVFLSRSVNLSLCLIYLFDLMSFFAFQHELFAAVSGVRWLPAWRGRSAASCSTDPAGPAPGAVVASRPSR